MADAGPIELWRGDHVESRHRVAACIADSAGHPLAAFGDVARPIYPRSAIKPLQALPLIESGAAERFGLGPAEIAIACASHRGEAMHVRCVADWLERVGLSPADLACGAHEPGERRAAEALIRAGEAPSVLHNNCSGKHAGMLTTAVHLDEPHAGYRDRSHPVQRRIGALLAEMTGFPLVSPGIDGCGVPNWPIPLAGLARAMARFGSGEGPTPAHAAAAARIAAAMHAHPEMVGGSDSPTTTLLAALPAITLKNGAEGVFLAAVPERGLGLALKVEDGAGRAAIVALIALLDALGVVPEAAAERLAPLARPVLRNHAGRVIGTIRPAEGWPGDLAGIAGA